MENKGLYKIVSRLGSALRSVATEIFGDDQDWQLSDETQPCISEVTAVINSAIRPMDTVFVHDASTSMATKDCYPSRLKASNNAAVKYVDKRAEISPDDRISLISFNTVAVVHSPLAPISDRRIFFESLRYLKARGGTHIASGLWAARRVFMEDIPTGQTQDRIRRIVLLTDGHGGDATAIAYELKGCGILIEVIGVGGDPSVVNEDLLRRVATTDSTGFTHYWFINNSQQLIDHYQQLATGIVWRGNSSDQK